MNGGEKACVVLASTVDLEIAYRRGVNGFKTNAIDHLENSCTALLTTSTLCLKCGFRKILQRRVSTDGSFY